VLAEKKIKDIIKKWIDKVYAEESKKD
jgi:hypothetical protein